MKRIAIFTMLALVAPSRAQDSDFDRRLALVEANMNGMMARHARMEGDIANLKEGQKQANDKLDALLAVKQTANAPKLVWQPPVLGAWGETRVKGRWVNADGSEVVTQPPPPAEAVVSQPIMMSTGGYSSGMQRTGLIRRVFNRGAGGCAGGS